MEMETRLALGDEEIELLQQRLKRNNKFYLQNLCWIPV